VLLKLKFFPPFLLVWLFICVVLSLNKLAAAKLRMAPFFPQSSKDTTNKPATELEVKVCKSFTSFPCGYFKTRLHQPPKP
jgi:hypothetical protein